MTIVLLDTHALYWLSVDPSRRLIYATALERGWPLVTRDERLHGHRDPDPAVW